MNEPISIATIILISLECSSCLEWDVSGTFSSILVSKSSLADTKSQFDAVSPHLLHCSLGFCSYLFSTAISHISETWTLSSFLSFPRYVNGNYLDLNSPPYSTKQGQEDWCYPKGPELDIFFRKQALSSSLSLTQWHQLIHVSYFVAPLPNASNLQLTLLVTSTKSQFRTQLSECSFLHWAFRNEGTSIFRHLINPVCSGECEIFVGACWIYLFPATVAIWKNSLGISIIQLTCICQQYHNSKFTLRSSNDVPI